MYLKKKAWLAEMRRWRPAFKTGGAEVDFPVYSDFSELRMQFVLKTKRKKEIAVEVTFVPVEGRDDLLNVRFMQLKPAIPGKLDAGSLAFDIEGIERRAREYCVRVESEAIWNERVEFVEGLLAQGSAEDLEFEGFYTRSMTRRGYDAHIAPITLAIAYCADARKALAASDLARAWCCVDRGEFFVHDDVLIDDPHKKFQDRARLGGAARAARRFDPVKRLVMELLCTHAPTGGWKNKAEASLLLAKYIDDTGLLSSDSLTYDNFQQTLYRWLMKDAELRDAFAAHRRQPARTSEPGDDSCAQT